MNDESGIIKSKWSRVILLSVWAAIALAFLVVYAADLRLSYDLIAGRYVADRQKTHEPPTNWQARDQLEASMFTPDALRRMGRR